MKRPSALAMAFLFFLTAGEVFAATAPVRVSGTRVAPAQATVGDEIKFFVQIDRPKNFSLSPLSEKINLAPFEIKRVEMLQPSGVNRVRETFVLTLTAFQLGLQNIPSFPIEYQAPSGQKKTLMTDPVQVRIVSVGKKSTDKGDIRPIKGPVRYGAGLIRNVFCAVTAFVLTLFLWLRRRKKKKEEVDRESLLPPDERARLELDRLKKQDLLAARKEKEFYSGLSDVLRRYLTRRWAVDALEKTTVEIITDLKEKNLERASVDAIRRVLEGADLVKFAKYEPPAAFAEDLEEEIRRIVQANTPKPADKAK